MLLLFRSMCLLHAEQITDTRSQALLEVIQGHAQPVVIVLLLAESEAGQAGQLQLWFGTPRGARSACIK